MTNALDALVRELGGPPPAGFAKLNAKDVAHLTGVVAEVRRRQAEALEAAAHAALNGVPRLLRRPVEKILGRS